MGSAGPGKRWRLRKKRAVNVCVRDREREREREREGVSGRWGFASSILWTRRPLAGFSEVFVCLKPRIILSTVPAVWEKNCSEMPVPAVSFFYSQPTPTSLLCFSVAIRAPLLFALKYNSSAKEPALSSGEIFLCTCTLLGFPPQRPGIEVRCVGVRGGVRHSSLVSTTWLLRAAG